MSRRWGVPHGMSKNRIAAALVSFLPAAENFCDLFAGGGAVTHAALESGKYSRVIYNDADPLTVDFFVSAISGKYGSGSPVIDRETFAAQKNADPYVRFIWSFGSKGNSYLWRRSVERVKLAACEMILRPSAESKAKFQHELRAATEAELTAEEIDHITAPANWNDRRLRYLNVMKKQFPRRYRELESLQRLQALEGLRALERLKNLGRVHSLERLEPLERLNALGRIDCPTKLVVSTRDYRDVAIPENSVIYCDIPYAGSTVNGDMHMGDFDFPAFCAWACRQDNIFVSSYDLPGDRFQCIWERERRSIMSSSDNKTTIKERLFVPRRD